VTLSRDEREDAARREEADRVREDGRKRFAREIAGRVEVLREAVKSVKGDIMGKGIVYIILTLSDFNMFADGLTHIFATVKTTNDVRDLPQNYRAVLEWARVSYVFLAFSSFPPLLSHLNWRLDWHQLYSTIT